MTPLLTEEEAAKLVQTSTRTIRKARAEGSLPHVKIGRLVRYRLEDIGDFIARCTVSNDRSSTSHSSASSARRSEIIGFSQRNGRQ